METRELTCYCCPRRCHIEAERRDPAGKWTIRGNGCDSGYAFALRKISEPLPVPKNETDHTI